MQVFYLLVYFPYELEQLMYVSNPNITITSLVGGGILLHSYASCMYNIYTVYNVYSVYKIHTPLTFPPRINAYYVYRTYLLRLYEQLLIWYDCKNVF